jgi:hypothetical protein
MRRYKFSIPKPRTGLLGSAGEPLPVPLFEATNLITFTSTTHARFVASSAGYLSLNMKVVGQ